MATVLKAVLRGIGLDMRYFHRDELKQSWQKYATI